MTEDYLTPLREKLLSVPSRAFTVRPESFTWEYGTKDWAEIIQITDARYKKGGKEFNPYKKSDRYLQYERDLFGVLGEFTVWKWLNIELPFEHKVCLPDGDDKVCDGQFKNMKWEVKYAPYKNPRLIVNPEIYKGARWVNGKLECDSDVYFLASRPTPTAVNVVKILGWISTSDFSRKHKMGSFNNDFKNNAPYMESKELNPPHSFLQKKTVTDAYIESIRGFITPKTDRLFFCQGRKK